MTMQGLLRGPRSLTNSLNAWTFSSKIIYNVELSIYLLFHKFVTAHSSVSSRPAAKQAVIPVLIKRDPVMVIVLVFANNSISILYPFSRTLKTFLQLYSTLAVSFPSGTMRKTAH
jgi:hypothetical protein